MNVNEISREDILHDYRLLQQEFELLKSDSEQVVMDQGKIEFNLTELIKGLNCTNKFKNLSILIYPKMRFYRKVVQ